MIVPKSLAVIIGITASVVTSAPLALIDQVPIKAPNHPYTPQHRDPYDRKVDSVGQDLEPLPWRNGDGATILGPQNKDRQRQNPDMIRPPSTDHGDMVRILIIETSAENFGHFTYP
jgi:hypothetical protein